jgi:hypothetical protein
MNARRDAAHNGRGGQGIATMSENISADALPCIWAMSRLKSLIEDALAHADAAEPGDDPAIRQGFIKIAAGLSALLRTAPSEAA